MNPGFVMDRLPLTLAAACVRVDHVHVTRIVDANKRRAPLRAKIGAGLTVEEFRAGVAARQPRPPRVRRIVRAHRPRASGCRSTTSGRPSTRWSPIGPASPPGGWPACASRRSACAAAARSSAWISRCPIAAPDPHDAVVIDGDPPLDVVIRGGTHGDRGTVGTVLSAIPAGDRGATRAEDDPDLALVGVNIQA